MSLNKKVQQILDDPNNYFHLEYKEPYYFSILHQNFTRESGWYIILCNSNPIYVGFAGDLNKRLNTDDGSRDNFGNPGKRSYSQRNFLKKYMELHILESPVVCIVRTHQLGYEGLTGLDRKNIEKHLNIWRGFFRFLPTPLDETPNGKI